MYIICSFSFFFFFLYLIKFKLFYQHGILLKILITTIPIYNLELKTYNKCVWLLI